MSTAIARICTPEGFVIAADGRKSRGGTDAIITDYQQKIFGIKQPGRRLAYALAGAVDLTHNESDKVLFDFVDETNKAVIKLASAAPKTIWHFATMLADSIIDGIEAVKQGPDVFDQSIENSLTHLFICGYYGTHAKSVYIDFTHHIHEPTEASPSSERQLSDMQQYGSPIVRELLLKEDPLFHAYVTPKRTRENARLHEAIVIARRDILAYFDPEALRIDKKVCDSIGGHIHMATVTFAGFQWVPGFEPKDQR